MCGRYVLSASPNALQEAFQLESVPEFAPRYNIAPTQLAPVITNEQAKTLSFFRWGLIPSWAKDVAIGNKMINARSEGVEDKPSFRAALKKRRCLVPATGFYEWRKDEDGKTPMYIQLQDEPVFGLAGLWEVWKDPATQEKVFSYTIMTTAANEFMKSLHDRMPVILKPEDYATWLEPDELPTAVAHELLVPYDPQNMTAYAVSRMVNKPSVDSEDCIAPLTA